MAATRAHVLITTLIIILSQLSLLASLPANGFNLTIATTNAPVSSPSINSNQNQYLRATRDTLLELRGLLLTKSIKFDESFRQLLSSSKRDFHLMFAQTYGLHYERNSEIFTDMYEDLERYYATGGVKLDKSMENFFRRLYQKMFQALNAQYEFNESYLNCISQQLEESKPFGDIAENFIAGIKKSFIATRTFLQALNNGIDIIKNVIELGQSTQCQALILTKLQPPPTPSASQQQQQGGVGVAIPVNKPPCLGFCEQVMAKSCFKYNQDLDREWNNYVDAITKLANKLRTSINIESVVDPIDLRISEAIMNFQDNGAVISQQVFQVCGMPQTAHYLSGGLMSQQPSLPPFGTASHVPMSGRYRRDYSNTGMLLRTRSNNRNRASILPTPPSSATAYSSPKPITSTSPLGPQSANNHYAPSTNTMMARNSQQSLVSSQASSPSPTTTNSSDEQKIENLIVEIRTQMNRTIGFWSRLPTTVCLNRHTLGAYTSKQISVQPNCYWSSLSEQDSAQLVGTSLSRHFKTTANGVQISAYAASEDKHSKTIQQQVNTLKMTINKISKAFDGLDVDWGETNPPSVPSSPPSISTSTTTTTSTTTITPEPIWTANGDDSESDENSLPWCPSSLSATQEGVMTSDNNDDQPTSGDTNRNTNSNGDEFGSGDGANDSDDDSSSDGDDSSEEDEDDSESGSSSSGHNDSENYNNGDNSSSDGGSTIGSTTDQQQGSATTSWYRGRPCRVRPNVDDVPAATTMIPNIDIEQSQKGIQDGEIPKNFTNSLDENRGLNNNAIDLSRHPNNNLDDSYPSNNLRLEIGSFPSDPQNSPPTGSSASPCTTVSFSLGLWIPLIVTVWLATNSRLKL